MTFEEIYSALTSSGSYTLPYLIELSSPDGSTVLRYVNQSEDVTFNDNTYKSEVFTFSPSAESLGFFGGGSLEIARNYNVVNLLENNTNIKFKAIGIIINGEIAELRNYETDYCTVTFSGSTVKIKLEKDDRLEMTFPATVFNTSNNSGNS